MAVFSIHRHQVGLGVYPVECTSTAAMGTEAAVQFADNVFVYGLRYRFPNGTGSPLSFWKYWSTDTNYGKALLYQYTGTDATDIFVSMHQSLGTDEAIVAVCTSTAMKYFRVEVGRWVMG